jgi:DNA helicase-2/ATP-dependent DNA helicase PcrA
MNDPILDNLNPQQLEAVTAPDGPLLIVAGAGSGKTRVITRRIAHLVRHRGVRPGEIIAATFTNKAADEMKRRVAQLLGDFSPHEFQIATFHSLCARILRREAAHAGIASNFLICDERDQLSAVKHVMKQLALSDKEVKPAQAQEIINQCKIRMLEPEDVGQVTSSRHEELYASIYEAYQKYLRENHALDFEDLIVVMVKLLAGNEAVRAHYQARYRHVMVDEYQDINASQFELVRLLACGHHNLTVVGDEDQSIYSWRGADISNILEFEKHFPDARRIRLEQNYRSTGNVLRAAGAVIANNRNRFDKTLFTDAGPGDPVYVIAAGSELDESASVVDAIRRLRREGGYRFGEMAIFYRVAALSRVYEDRLREHKIPHRVIGGVRFYDRAEIKDMLAYLQVVENPDNTISLLRVINKPKRGIGEKSVQALVDLSRRIGGSVFKALCEAHKHDIVPRGALKQIDTLLRQLSEWRQFSRTRKPSETYACLRQGLNFDESLGDPEAMEVRSRIEHLDELLNAMVLYESEHPCASLQDYLENVSLMSSTDDLKEGEPGVSLLTLHSAKGLEFKVVFIVGLDDEIMPNARSVAEGCMEEERRLFYVGITRAREILFLTRSDTRMLYGELRRFDPSCFFGELPGDLLSHIHHACGFDPGGRAPGLSPRDTTPGVRMELEGPPASGMLGKRVRHPLLGDGEVVGIKGRGDRVSFIVQLDDGTTLQLVARHARLEVIG